MTEILRCTRQMDRDGGIASVHILAGSRSAALPPSGRASLIGAQLLDAPVSLDICFRFDRYLRRLSLLA